AEDQPRVGVRRRGDDHRVDAEGQRLVEGGDRGGGGGERGGEGAADRAGIRHRDDVRQRALDEHAEEGLPPGPAADERDAEVRPPGPAADERDAEALRDPWGAGESAGAALPEPAGGGELGRASPSCFITASDAGLPGWMAGPLMSTTNW